MLGRFWKKSFEGLDKYSKVVIALAAVFGVGGLYYYGNKAMIKADNADKIIAEFAAKVNSFEQRLNGMEAGTSEPVASIIAAKTELKEITSQLAQMNKEVTRMNKEGLKVTYGPTLGSVGGDGSETSQNIWAALTQLMGLPKEKNGASKDTASAEGR